jgi:hypothetical protein
MDIPTMIEQSQTRKRGRPRKNSISPAKVKTPKDKKADVIEEDIIVRMSISACDVNNDKVNGFELIQTECCDVESSSSSDLTDGDVDDKPQLLKLLQEKEQRIAELEAILSSSDSTKQRIDSHTETINPNIKNVNISAINSPFGKDADGNIIIPECTHEICLWDMHEINGVPVFLPDSYRDEKFHTSSWFCSLNCALAYNLKLDDYNVSERNSLLKWMYGKTGEIIEPAPSFRIINKFGGLISIEDYRHNLITCEKDYRIVTPPMTFITQTLEEKMSHSRPTKKKATIMDAMRHKVRK